MTSASTIAPGDPSVPLPPSWRLMLSHPAHQVSFGFGSGLIRPAPGTWGTLFAWLVFVVLDPWLGDAGWAIVIAATFVLGAAAAHRTGRALGRPDHGAIVIDEIVAFWLVLWLLPGGVVTQAVAFLGFRFFDILKPPPIRAVDRRFKNGLGVMLDDLLAAFYTLLAASVLARVFA
ncbi:MAG: phosphatidylglycerophosphatase A [Betaproteobacteria bacterium]